LKESQPSSLTLETRKKKKLNGIIPPTEYWRVKPANNEKRILFLRLVLLGQCGSDKRNVKKLFRKLN